MRTVTQNNASPAVRNARQVSTVEGMGGLLPLANLHPNNEYKLDECHGDGGYHYHSSTLIDAGPRKKHTYLPVH